MAERVTKKGKEARHFVTSLDLDPREVTERYGWGWRIETNNREFEKFRALTTSPNMKIRRIYFALSMILYNFWIVVRGGEGRPRAYEFKKMLEELLPKILKELERKDEAPSTLTGL